MTKISKETSSALLSRIDEIETKSVGSFQRTCCNNCEIPGREAIENQTVLIRHAIRSMTEVDPGNVETK